MAVDCGLCNIRCRGRGDIVVAKVVLNDHEMSKGRDVIVACILLTRTIFSTRIARFMFLRTLSSRRSWLICPIRAFEFCDGERRIPE